MLSMDSPFSSFFSISIISLTPSTTHSLEMSNTPPTDAVSTPPEKTNEDGGVVWSGSHQTWHVCLCPGWRGRSE
uniref:Uncharacterized protein n=2 Tax=Cyprinus carpio TaxID=7962 RepID=A0A9J7XUR8_CYPCA